MNKEFREKYPLFGGYYLVPGLKGTSELQIYKGK
jgi:hypothetical protein